LSIHRLSCRRYFSSCKRLTSVPRDIHDAAISTEAVEVAQIGVLPRQPSMKPALGEDGDYLGKGKPRPPLIDPVGRTPKIRSLPRLIFLAANTRQTYPEENRMLRPDRFIASCASWSEFWEGTKRLSSTGEKGAVFERLTNFILKQFLNINQNWNISGPFARCRRTFANFSPFQPSTKASIL
jgi:hypothetical protein